MTELNGNRGGWMGTGIGLIASLLWFSQNLNAWFGETTEDVLFLSGIVLLFYATAFVMCFKEIFQMTQNKINYVSVAIAVIIVVFFLNLMIWVFSQTTESSINDFMNTSSFTFIPIYPFLVLGFLIITTISLITRKELGHETFPSIIYVLCNFLLIYLLKVLI